MDSSDGYPGPFGRQGFDFNTRIMVTAILSFSIVIILVFVLHVYARYFLRRRPHRRSEARTHQLSHDGGGVDSGEPPKTGLDPLIIASLPTFVFKQSENLDYASSITECAVCLSNLEDKDIARVLPNCYHTFHAVCIDKWLTSRSTCPICRAEAKPQLMPEPREAPASGSSSSPRENFTLSIERAGDHGNGDTQSPPSPKVNGSSSRLSSFRRMVSRERSSRRIHSSAQEDDTEDLERQRGRRDRPM